MRFLIAKPRPQTDRRYGDETHAEHISCNFAFQKHNCTAAMAEQIERFRLDWPASSPGYVVHAGEIEMPLSSSVRALPMGML